MLGAAAGKMAPQLRELAAFPGDFVQFQYLCLAELTTASSRDPWPSMDTHTRTYARRYTHRHLGSVGTLL